MKKWAEMVEKVCAMARNENVEQHLIITFHRWESTFTSDEALQYTTDFAFERQIILI